MGQIFLNIRLKNHLISAIGRGLILLCADDFSLSHDQIEKIQNYISKKSSEYAVLDEDPASDVSVTFHFSPLGREIEVRFDAGPAFAIE